MRNAGIYARISSDRTGAGLGVDRQVADCRELALRLGWEVHDVYADNNVSAWHKVPAWVVSGRPTALSGEMTLAHPGMASPEAARAASQGINRGIVSPFRNSWSSDTHLAPMFLIRPAHSSETTVHAISSWLSKTTS